MSMKPNRFLLFGVTEYDPSGGWDDLLATRNTYEEAVAAMKEDVCESGFQNHEYYHIIDLDTGRRVDF